MRRSEIEVEDGVVTSVSVGGATAYIASGETEVLPYQAEYWEFMSCEISLYHEVKEND